MDKIFHFKKGQIGVYVSLPSNLHLSIKDNESSNIWNGETPITINYEIKSAANCISTCYIDLIADLSKYSSISFMIKGLKVNEGFDVIFGDDVSNKLYLENIINIGPVERFISNHKLTTDWQLVEIPCDELYGVNIETITSMIFDFPIDDKGSFMIKELHFNYKSNFNYMRYFFESGYMLFDNFNHSYYNFTGNKYKPYNNPPSSCRLKLDDNVFYGNSGRSLKLTYDKQSRGWCGYSSRLNKVDYSWFDLSGF